MVVVRTGVKIYDKGVDDDGLDVDGDVGGDVGDDVVGGGDLM